MRDGDKWYESADAMHEAKGLTRRLTEWAEGGTDGLTKVHEHWLSAEQINQLEAGHRVLPASGRRRSRGRSSWSRQIVEAAEAPSNSAPAREAPRLPPVPVAACLPRLIASRWPTGPPVRASARPLPCRWRYPRYVCDSRA
jgi:hypothetical protein